MSSFLIYVKDKEKYYDTQNGGALISLEKAIQRLKAYDEKFENDAEAYSYLQDARRVGVFSSDLKASKNKKSVNLNEIWEELRPLILMKKRINQNGQSQIFYISKNNEVSKIDYTDDQSLMDALQARKDEFVPIREFYNNSPLLESLRQSTGFYPFLKRMLLEFWAIDERCIFDGEPKPVSWTGEELAYKQMNSSLLKPGPTPSWDEFTTRLDYPQVFMAWVWGIFEPTNNVRQVMWLKGAGNDGKSSVQKALEAVVGRDQCYSMKEGDQGQQWFGKNVFGKVLVNYADCKYQDLIDTNGIKQLTGGDTTSIEGKGENSFAGKIYSKVLVTSNFTPKINPELQAHLSRLIKLEVQAQADAVKDSGFEQRLQKEIYAFLTKCKECFDALISPGGDRLILPVDLLEKIKTECASDTYMNVQDFVEEYVQFGASDVCVPADLRRTSKKYFSLNKQISSEGLKNHETELNNKLTLQGCAMQRVEFAGKVQTVWKGFKLKKTFEM